MKKIIILFSIALTSLGYSQSPKNQEAKIIFEKNQEVFRSLEFSKNKEPIVNGYSNLLVMKFEKNEEESSWWDVDELFLYFHDKNISRELFFDTTESSYSDYDGESSIEVSIKNEQSELKIETINTEFINGNYILYNENSVYIFQLEDSIEATRAFYILWNSLLIEKIFDDEILDIYEALSYENIHDSGSESLKFGDEFEDNIIQIVVEGVNYFYIYKIDTESKSPFFYYEEEEIARLKKHFSKYWSVTPMEFIFLKEERYIDYTTVKYTDFEYETINDNIFEWEAKDIVQIYTLKEIEGINKILDIQ